jgi:serine/threonine protein kinase
MANCFENLFSKLSIAPTPQLSDKPLQYLTCSTWAPNPTESFTKTSFLKNRNLIVDLQNCVGKGTFGSLYVAEQLLMVLEEMVNVMLMSTLSVVLPLQCLQRWPYNVFLHDSYSLGVILYELSHNRQFPHSPDSDINWNLKDEWLMAYNKKKHDLQSVKFRDTISRELKQLILSLLQPNPQNRKWVRTQLH